MTPSLFVPGIVLVWFLSFAGVVRAHASGGQRDDAQEDKLFFQAQALVGAAVVLAFVLGVFK